MTQYVFGIAILCSAVAIVVVFSLPNFFGATRAEYNDSNPAVASAYWNQQIRDRGAEAAYAEFIEKNLSSAENDRHLLAHIVGEKIFENVGHAGISVCDSSFGFGCYHGFFGQAFAYGGVESIEELDAICLSAFGPLGTGCQHGIGHGVLEYVGYQNINEALLLCGKTTQSAPLLGCASGVFMEFNTPLVGVSDTLVPETRKFAEETADEPCRNIPDSYKKSCYFELGGWLANALHGDDAGVGKVCSSFSTEWRLSCFQGFGNAVAHRMQYKPETSRALCDMFSSEDALFCRAGVAWAMYSVPEHRALTESACAYPDSKLRARCMKLADLTEGKSGFPNL